MTNFMFCETCGKPATLSGLKDPFGKSDDFWHRCMEHAPFTFGLPSNGETKHLSVNTQRWLQQFASAQWFCVCGLPLDEKDEVCMCGGSAR